MSFIALSITPTGYGRLVSGLTHLSETMVAMSHYIDSSWLCRSPCLTLAAPPWQVSANTTKLVTKGGKLSAKIHFKYTGVGGYRFLHTSIAVSQYHCSY